MDTEDTGLIIEEYSDKSFVVRGNTRSHSTKLKELSGSYNSRLKCGPGWIFSKSKKDNVTNYILKNNVKVVESKTQQFNLDCHKESNKESNKEESNNFISNLAVSKILERLEQKIDKILSSLVNHSEKIAIHDYKYEEDKYEEDKYEEDITKPKKRLLGNKI